MADGDLYVPHLSLVFGGSFWGSETWQMGLRLSNPGGLGANADTFCADHLDDAKSDVSSWWLRNTTGGADHASLDWIKLNAIGPDGKYVNKTTTHQARYSPSVQSGDYPQMFTRSLPPQVALVISLRTGNRGPREAFGHVYLPCDGLELNSGQPTITDNACHNVATSFATLIADLNDWPGIDSEFAPVVVIASKYSSYVPKGGGSLRTFQAAVTPVTDVWVGNKFDTHRSRARSIAQTYSKVAI